MTNEKDQKAFWKLLNRLSCKPNKTSSYVSHNSLYDHFKSLLYTSNHNRIPPEDKEYDPLDYPITSEELKKGFECLKPGKAVASDNLSNEMISCLLEVSPVLQLKLFNSVLTGGDIPPEWMVSYIVPIHKDGTR